MRAYHFVAFVGIFFSTLMFNVEFAYGQNQQIADSLKSLDLSQLDLKDKTKVLQKIASNSTLPGEVIKFSDEVLEIAIDEKDKAIANTNLAQAYKLLGKLPKALECAIKALTINKYIQNKQGIAAIANTISTIYLELENFTEAKRYLRLSIEINKELGNPIYLAGDYNNLGEVYRMSGVLDSAIFYFNKAKTLYEQNNFSHGKAYAMGNIGLVLAAKGEFNRAGSQLTEAKKILMELQDYYPMVVYDQYLAEIMQTKGQLNRAILLAVQALHTAQEHGLRAQARDLSNLLSTLYAEKENYKQAHHYQGLFMGYRDSIMNEDNLKKIADLQASYDLNIKQAEIDLLNKEKSLQQYITFGLIGIVLLCLAFALNWYRNSREKQQTNQMLLKQTEELTRLNRTRDKFFSIISHDLRGPVNAFDGISKLMEHYAESGNFDRMKEASHHLNKSARQLSGLLDNLLGWSVSQQGEFPYRPEALSVTQLAADVCMIFENMAHGKNIDLHFDIPKELMVWADHNSLSTILRNLVSNAIKFTPEGGEVYIKASKQIGQLILEVKDTGLGISADRLQKILEFRDEQRSYGTAGEKGLGIGLRLAFEFTAMNKGRLLVDSTEGKGTTFTLCLPLHQDKLAEVQPA